MPTLLNPMSTFVPAPGLRVHDKLNDRSHRLERAIAENMEREAHRHFGDDGRLWNWNGLLLAGWLGQRRPAAG